MKFSKIIMAMALAASAAGSAMAAGDADFALVNQTGYPIREVYVSPSKSNEWGDDRMGKSVLANGATRAMRFGDSAHCHQDMQVVFDDDGTKVTWENVNLCELAKLTLKYNRSSGAVSATAE